MTAPRIDALVAIGDNLSIDTASTGPHRGAASLLYRNRDTEYPDFKARDMVTRDPAVRLLTLGQDGATARTTLTTQMKRLPQVDDPVLVVVTAGTKDLLALTAGGTPGVRDEEGMYETLNGIFDEVARHFSDAILFLGNIPDPTDGNAPEPLAAFNAVIADVAREQGAALIDIHGHFAGHGPDAGEDAWLTLALDPTPIGAHEIRRLFWQALMDY
ncbi:MAG TPA: SGNH/GDSL hydrolase family protein [Armatimonadota bacterium]